MAKILVVDDEEELAKLYSTVLTGSGHQAMGVYSGKQAFKQVKKQNFDLVITDFQMPKMTGLELLKAIRKKGKNIPVILMTGKVSELPAEELKNFAKVLAKPIDIKELPKIVAKVLAASRC